MEDNSISLNKYISQTGICSRREADKWIEAGRVKINGKVAKKGNRVIPKDKVTIDNRPIKNKPKPIYIALNKPPGITSTTDKRDKDNIISFAVLKICGIQAANQQTNQPANHPWTGKRPLEKAEEQIWEIG